MLPAAQRAGSHPRGTHRAADRRAVRRPGDHQPRAHPEQHAHQRRPALQPGQRRGGHPQPLRHGRHHQRPHLQRAGRRRREGHRHRRHARHDQGNRLPGQQQAFRPRDSSASSPSRPAACSTRKPSSQDRQKLLEYYADKGFEETDIKTAVAMDDRANTATVTFTITEGPKGSLQRRAFRGQPAHLHLASCATTMKNTRGKTIISFIDKSGRLDPNKMHEDLDCHPRALPEQGLHRRGRAGAADRARRQGQHLPAHRHPRRLPVPRRHAEFRGHPGLHRRGDPPLPQDEGGQPSTRPRGSRTT